MDMMDVISSFTWEYLDYLEYFYNLYFVFYILYFLLYLPGFIIPRLLHRAPYVCGSTDEIGNADVPIILVWMN